MTKLSSLKSISLRFLIYMLHYILLLSTNRFAFSLISKTYNKYKRTKCYHDFLYYKKLWNYAAIFLLKINRQGTSNFLKKSVLPDHLTDTDEIIKYFSSAQNLSDVDKELNNFCKHNGMSSVTSVLFH